jgi:hypothetical protein
MRHEDIDQHHVERGRVERRKASLTAIRNGDLEALMSKAGLNGSANQRIVINHKNARQDLILPDRESRNELCVSSRLGPSLREVSARGRA